jgi:hypothetical protein
MADDLEMAGGIPAVETTNTPTRPITPTGKGPITTVAIVDTPDPL